MATFAHNALKAVRELGGLIGPAVPSSPDSDNADTVANGEAGVALSYCYHRRAVHFNGSTYPGPQTCLLRHSPDGHRLSQQHQRWTLTYHIHIDVTCPLNIYSFEPRIMRSVYQNGRS